MRTIAISNQKGGVGKTTLSYHLAYYAADQKFKTLIVDLDEGDLTSLFLPEIPDSDAVLVASLLFKTAPKKAEPIVINPYLSIIPADNAILNVDDLPLKSVIKPKDNLERFQNSFDLCIIDTPPNLQRRLIAALTVADAVVAPIHIDSFSFSRLAKLQTTIENITDHLNPELRFLGILLNKINGFSQKEKEAISEIKSSLGEYYIDSPIFNRASITVALANHLPVWRNATSGSQKQAAKETRRACKTILDKLGN